MEKYYKILECSPSVSLKELKRQYIFLMKKTHPDKGYSDGRCKEINEAYQNILEFRINFLKYDNVDDKQLQLIPKEFRDMGFTKFPTVDQYVRRKIAKTKKIEELKKELHDSRAFTLEANKVLQLKDKPVEKMGFFDKIINFFFEDVSSSEEEDD